MKERERGWIEVVREGEEGCESIWVRGKGRMLEIGVRGKRADKRGG